MLSELAGRGLVVYRSSVVCASDQRLCCDVWCLSEHRTEYVELVVTKHTVVDVIDCVRSARSA